VPRVYQSDPPGLMHDDPRLLPPWRGSSLLSGHYLPSSDYFAGRFLESGLWFGVLREPHVLIECPSEKRCFDKFWVGLCTATAFSTDGTVATGVPMRRPARWVGDPPWPFQPRHP
jgi:hypothetical protein